MQISSSFSSWLQAAMRKWQFDAPRLAACAGIPESQVQDLLQSRGEWDMRTLKHALSMIALVLYLDIDAVFTAAGLPANFQSQQEGYVFNQDRS